MVVASIIFGILGLLSFWVPIIGLIFAGIALLLGIIAVINKNNTAKTGLKITALVIAIVAVGMSYLITSTILGVASIAVDLMQEVTAMADKLEDEPELKELASDLYNEYLYIIIENKFTKGKISDEDAERRYIDILMNEHRDLFNEGYDIKIKEDYKFEIISPDETKI